MYFAQEFIPLNAAIIASAGIVLLIIAVRSLTIMKIKLAFLGVLAPSAAILALTLVAAIHTRLQGMLITVAGIALFVVGMTLMPRLKVERAPALSPAGAA